MKSRQCTEAASGVRFFPQLPRHVTSRETQNSCASSQNNVRFVGLEPRLEWGVCRFPEV